MKLHEIDILIICAYLIAMIVIGLILKKRAAQNMDSYFLGGILGICLRIQEPLDSLVVASVQPNLSNGLSVRVVTSFQCTHWSRMD